METISNELTVTGNPDDLDVFMDEFGEPGSIFSPLDCSRDQDLGFDLIDDFCRLRFKSDKVPSKEWLDSIKTKYPSFKVSVFWKSVSEVGFIKKDGTEYIFSTQELKKAVKMYERK